MALAAALAAGVAGCRHTAADRPAHAPAPRPPVAASALQGRLVYSTESGNIWVSDLRGHHARRVVRGPRPHEDPSLSPDGRFIAYRDSHRGINVDDDIRVIALRGGRSRRLTRSAVNDWGPAWSPDGHLIAYNSGLQLHVMRPDGSRDRIVTARVEAEYPSWAPDGRRLAFMSARPNAHGNNPNYDIYVVSLDGSGLRRLTGWPGEEGWPAWSPDGRWIAFTTTHDDVGQSEIGGPYTDIWLMHPDGTGKRRLVRGMLGTLPAWSPDGRTIVFTGSPLDRERRRLWVIRPDGSGLRELPIAGYLADWGRPLE